jgi:hypothetical protein
MASAAKSES